jgi:hypothetical protein
MMREKKMWYVCVGFIAVVLGFLFGVLFGNYLSEEAVKPVQKTRQRDGRIEVLIRSGDELIWHAVSAIGLAAADGEGKP